MSPLQLGDAVCEKALESPIASSRYQQLDRALAYYKDAEAVNPGDIEIQLRCVATRFLASGKSAELLALAKAEAAELGRAGREGEGIDSFHARAVSEVVAGDRDLAFQAYSDLTGHKDADTSYLAKSRHLARSMARTLGLAANSFDEAFPPLRLIVFSGHLPPRVNTGLQKLIERELEELQATVGVASAAAGADLLFLDSLHARGGTSHVILPWSKKSFRETSILPFSGQEGGEIWEKLFDEALERSVHVREIGEVAGPDSPVAWQYLLEVSAGIAKRIARKEHLDIVPLAVWDGSPGIPGGTAAFCEFWREQLKIEPKVIMPPEILTRREIPRISARVTHRAEKKILQQAVKSMLFMDVVGFSSLPESSIPGFIESFLHRVSEVVAKSPHAPHSINTWGDAVYAVFDFVQDAGRFALELNEMVEKNASEWKSLGLGELQIRTGLHAGPVFLNHDPIVRRLGFSGAHVSRAARIEPSAKPGEILTSEEFAALAAISPGGGFSLQYAQTYKLQKNYPGNHRLYRLTRDRSADLLLLAKEIHEDYCVKARSYGDTSDSNPSMVPWDNLPPGLQFSNLAQADDIPYKLRALGYELADSGGIQPSEIVLDPELVEPLARLEHDRWMAEKMKGGWVYAPVRENQRLHHPLLVPYEDLPEHEKQKDRDTVHNIPLLLAKAGYRVNAL